MKRTVGMGGTKKEQQMSTEWLKAQLQNFAPYSRKSTPEKTRKEIGGESVPIGSLGERPSIGSMYMFSYKAKHADTLPFWDAFPLTILVGGDDKALHSLNVHYLPPALRAKFFDALLDIMSTKKVITPESRFVLTYNLLKSTSKFRYFKPCYKTHLLTNIKSRVIKINPDDWWRVLFLQNAQWQNASQSTVYKWSRDQL